MKESERKQDIYLELNDVKLNELSWPNVLVPDDNRDNRGGQRSCER